ncbi:MAG: hypothetical protein D6766_01135, partial [Verrucomicrobia bacterium]
MTKRTKREILDLYFLEARSKLIDLAAFLDRVDRAEGEADFRLEAFRGALRQLADDLEPGRAARILMAFSDPTTEPVAQAPGQGAIGAWRPAA